MKQQTTLQSLAALLLAATVLNAQLAPPAGVIRIDLPAGQDVMASLPFETDSSAVQDVLSNLDLTDGCHIFKWDAASQSYRSATLVQGIWSSDASGDTPSEMTLDNSEGFIIRNPGKTDQQLYLAGTVVIDNRFTAPLYPGLTLIAPPYSADIEVSRTSLAPDALAAQASDLLIGNAYWHHSTRDTSASWVTTPPYSLTFSPTALPAITYITVNDGTPTLTIETQGPGTDQINIFYRDIAPTDAHLTPGDWTLATSTQSGGAGAVYWTDRGSKNREPVSSIAGRYYAVTHTTIDADTNGTPDDANILAHSHTADTPTTPRASALATTTSEQTKDFYTTANSNLSTIYVDSRDGKDTEAKTGGAISGSKQNPKRTISAAIADAESGDTIVVMAGSYAEKVRLPIGIKMRLNGKVKLL